jgi:hypothetical protein
LNQLIKFVNQNPQVPHGFIKENDVANLRDLLARTSKVAMERCKQQSIEDFLE